MTGVQAYLIIALVLGGGLAVLGLWSASRERKARLALTKLRPCSHRTCPICRPE